MGKLRIGRPSPAMVVAVLALVMASIGTSIAAFQLPRKSVATKHIKHNAVKTRQLARNAVTGAKVRKRTLTGADINLGRLGVVPLAAHATRATHAAVAEVARGITAPEPVHLVGAPGEPPFAPGARNLGLLPKSGIALPPVSFYKDREGLVRLEGAATPGMDDVIFVLPPGFRPGDGTVQVFDIETNLEGEAIKGIVIFGSNMRDQLGNDLSGAVTSLGSSTLLTGISFRAGS